MDANKESEIFIKGFNQGYELEGHDPEIAQTVREGFKNVDHPYVRGFEFGTKEFQKEKGKH